MSIPDLALLDYTITLECGHKRHTMAPTAVGKLLPCLNSAHYGGRELKDVTGPELISQKVTKIHHDEGNYDVEFLGWMTPQAAFHGMYDDAKNEGDSAKWWEFGKKRRAKELKGIAVGGIRAGLR